MGKFKPSWSEMMKGKGGLRNAARAIIIKDGDLLCTKNEDPAGIFYLFPGGGQKMGETLPETLKRECLEEVGAVVSVGELLYMREYIGAHHEFARYDSHVHQLEFFFSCQILSQKNGFDGEAPDSFQLGVEWLPLHGLQDVRVYPKALSPLLSSPKNNRSIYLGDIN